MESALGNTVSGNLEGIIIGDVGTDDNEIVGNRIGTDDSGNLPLPNSRHGVQVWNTHSGFGAGPQDTLVQGNRVSWNGWDGIFLGTGMRTRISENSITANSGRAIAALIGANGDTEPPVLVEMGASHVSGIAAVSDGSVIEVFHDSEDEAESFLGFTLVNNQEFTFNGSVPTTGQIRANVTDGNGNTSRLSALAGETSRSFYAADAALNALVVVNTDGSGARIGDLGVNYVRGGLAHRPDGVLYLLNQGGDLYRVSKLDGSATQIGNLGFPDVETACFRADGWMYVAVSSEVVDTGALNDTLILIHPTSLRSIVVGEIGVDIDALICLEDGSLLGLDTLPTPEGEISNDVYQIDLTSGVGTPVWTIPDFNIVGAALQDGEVTVLSYPSFLLSLEVEASSSYLFGGGGGPAMLTLAPTSPLPLDFGDFDDDGQTDLADYGLFATCLNLSGPGLAPPFAECLEHFDWDDDGDVDLQDFLIFQRALIQTP